MRTSRNFIFLVAGICLIASLGASSFEGARPYQSVSVFKVEKRVVYAIDAAEIYFSVQSRFAIPRCSLELSSSHPAQLSMESERATTSIIKFDTILPKDAPARFVYKVLKRGEFSMASISLRINFEYPNEEIGNWIEKNSFRYPDSERRNQLIQSLPESGSQVTETEGIFIYGRKFLK